ncbi:MAG: hypothetical protein HW416_793 [Chloroflexi bacterium]|nr:hypothetical protein [Chloroflexota bacterium]
MKGAPPWHAVIAVAVYCASILAANWLIRNVGVLELPDGTHLMPVGFGLMAPSGAYAAGLTFVARDVVQRTAGRRWALGAMALGALLSAAIDPRLAIASGTAFLVSELADFGVYTPLEEHGFVVAVVASGIVGSIIDSLLFLTIAGIPLDVALPGLLLGKVWVQLIAAPIAAWMRPRLPVATA